MIKAPSRFLILFLCAFLVLGTAGCAHSVDPKEGTKAGISDPLEPVNRGVFAVNNALDKVLFDPICRVYNALLPDFARAGVHNFMRNLSSPILVGNELLQGDVRQAGVSTARFVINTTAGIGGLMDPAASVGLQYRDADFGQTLGVWGVGSGPYLVIPVLGPSSLRDAAGTAVDSYADPVRFWAYNTHHRWVYYTKVGVDFVDQRSRIMKPMNDLRNNSLDYYAAVRSAYAQERRAMVHHKKPESVDIPDYGSAAKQPDHP
jgi:phospholipid-binding lipoprotein MlaA